MDEEEEEGEKDRNHGEKSLQETGRWRKII